MNLFEHLITVFKKGREELGWSFATIGLSLVLLVIVLLPLLSWFFDIGFVTDWYRFATTNHSPLFWFNFYYIMFLWLFLFAVMVGHIRSRVAAEKGFNEGDGKKLSKLFVIVGLFLVAAILLQLTIFNRHEDRGPLNFVIALTFVLAFIFLKYGFVWILKKISLSQFWNSAVHQVRNNTGSLGKWGRQLENIGKPILKKISPDKILADQLETKFTTKWLAGKTQSNNREAVSRYIGLVRQLGMWTVVAVLFVTVALFLTKPTSVYHGQMPVAFHLFLFLTLLLSAGILIFFDELSGLAIAPIKALANRVKHMPVHTVTMWLFALVMVVGISVDASNDNDLETIRVLKHSGAADTGSCMNEESNKPLIIVAASGGGIAASAWTAGALTELKSKFNDIYGCIVAISSVSGGSLGAFYHIAFQLGLENRECSKEPCERRTDGDAFKFLKLNPNMHFSPSFHFASRTSLGAVAWGAAVPGWSRGETLMERWVSVNCDKKDKEEIFVYCQKQKKLLNGSFNDWQQGMGSAPHLLINTTNEASGVRVVFSTDDDFAAYMKDADKKRGNGVNASTRSRVYSARHCVGYSRVVLAVKHSANFPYVTDPSGTVFDDIDGCRDQKYSYYIDGGYIDNEGLQSALDYAIFLKQKFENKKIIIVNTEAFPARGKHKKDYRPESRGWIDTLTSPIKGLASIRKTHALRNLIDIERVSDKHNIVSLQLSYLAHAHSENDYELPLSWHLTPLQKSWIVGQFEKIENKQIPKAEDLEKRRQCKSENKELTLQDEFDCLQYHFVNYEVRQPDELIEEKFGSGSEQPKRMEKWMSNMIPRFCRSDQKPVMIASTGIFKTGYPKKDNPLANQDEIFEDCPLAIGCSTEPKSCAKEKQDEVHTIHVVGFANEPAEATKNLDLSERRAQWLKKNLEPNFKHCDANFSVHGLGEDAYLPHPVLMKNEHEFKIPGDALQKYAMAFTCTS